MKILITGGAGYIGSELVNHFIRDHEVVVLDSLMYDATSLLRYSSNPNFKFIRGDVRNIKLLSRLMQDCDVIIPLAALVGFPICRDSPREAREVNYEINKWIANNKSKDQKVIYPCTNSGYGSRSDGICTEESPLNPITLYGITKVDAEKAYKDVENHVTFRLATVFGPSSRMRTDLLVNNFVLKTLRDRVLVLYECEFMRNYGHLQDVCRAFKFVVDNWDSCKNETYNMGNDALNMNKLQLAQKIQEHLPLEIIKAEFTSDPDVRDYIVSSQKFYDKGFKCQYDLDDGIRQLLTAYDIIESPWYANY
jgi:nucleoside-diphosphate-sugar epimerase|tara:strand:+ start:1246 stop:2169 length:924 start_codon:yes stop_codon:yes gene_type:complete